ncbi:hypothetical protein E2C01_031415 [Portunus trituberculatus]|uniref:Uncharacterized protein n=1 Tax=Portunus trituberculatus TaxID=210409 RepID=A0A5B7ESS1_PORTR|nr:hypothetical protein [Portunus trituberculatus]
MQAVSGGAVRLVGGPLPTSFTRKPALQRCLLSHPGSPPTTPSRGLILSSPLTLPYNPPISA